MKLLHFPKKTTTIENLEKEFPHLNFKFMGDLHKYPGSTHYHVTSKEAADTGVVEITFLTEKNSDLIEIKLATNRVGTWGEEGFENFKEYLENKT